jgi:hypothetical protein
MKARTARTVAASAAAVIAVGLTAVSPAAAKDGDIVVRGNCTAATDYKFKVQPRGSVHEYEFEVDSNRNGQAWNVRITDNGVVVFRGTRTTTAPSGSFSVEGRTANRAGTDVFVARATNPTTGERCTARISA